MERNIVIHGGYDNRLWLPLMPDSFESITKVSLPRSGHIVRHTSSEIGGHREHEGCACSACSKSACAPIGFAGPSFR